MSDSPIVIRTGLPGNGKTLNTIKEVDAYAKASGRFVYYHNIAGLNPDRLSASWFEFDNPTLWYELPRDSIIVIDEAQGSKDRPMFGTRDPRQAVPEHISQLETIRHGGYQLHLITQDPRFLDVHARRLCNAHIHYWRIFGSQKVSRYEMPRVMPDVEKLSTFKDATRTIITLDKKMFGVYESAKGGHHFKFKPPKKAVMFGVVLLVVLYLLFQVYQRINAPTSPAPGAAPNHSTSVASAVSTVSGFVAELVPGKGSPGKVSTVESYIAARLPRMPDVPSSAPLYDEVVKPVAAPRLSCVASTDQALLSSSSGSRRFTVRRLPGAVPPLLGCACFSQQATLVDVSFAFCLNSARYGQFDPSRADLARSDRTGGK